MRHWDITFPKLFVEKIGEDGVDIYIDKQEKIIATKKNRVIML